MRFPAHLRALCLLAAPLRPPNPMPMLAGLIFATEDAEGRAGTLAATLPFGGMTLIEYQARLLAAAGVGQIVVAVGRVTPALLGAVSRIAKREVTVDIVRSAEEASAKIHPLATVVVIADGLVTTDTMLHAMAGEAPDAILVTPEAEASGAVERLDRGQCWAGVATLSAQRLAEVAALPREYDFQSTVLRIAVEAGARHVALPASARRSGHGVERDAEVLAGRSNDVLGALANQRTGWADRWFFTPITRFLLPQLVRREVPAWATAVAGGGAGLLALVTLGLGHPAPGMLLALLSVILLSAGSLLSWLRGDNVRASQQEQGILLLAVLSALLLGIIASLAAGHATPFVLALWGVASNTVADRVPVRPRPWYASAASQVLLLTPFALLGLATLGLALATLHAVVSLAAAVEASRHKA